MKRIREKLKETFRKARGRRLDRFIDQELTPILRGWGNYFQMAQVEGEVRRTGPVGEKKASPDVVAAMETKSYSGCPAGSQRLEKQRAVKSAGNGRGSW